jgi:AGZA family xanthine/uracil permease-like MFS transporter
MDFGAVFVATCVASGIGTIMVKGVRRIDWDDLTEAIPAFLVIIMMPLTISITEGIAFGFIAFTLLKLVAGRGDEVNWVVYLFTVLFIIRYLVLV